MQVKIKKENKKVELPKKGTSGSAAYDLYISEDCFIEPHSRGFAETGLMMEFSSSLQAIITARSGFASKGLLGSLIFDKNKNHDLSIKTRLDADVIEGKIDSDYRGLVKIIVKNNESRRIFIKKGTGLAQLTFEPIQKISFLETEELNKTDRGDGGFGHTDKK